MFSKYFSSMFFSFLNIELQKWRIKTSSRTMFLIKNFLIFVFIFMLDEYLRENLENSSSDVKWFVVNSCFSSVFNCFWYSYCGSWCILICLAKQLQWDFESKHNSDDSELETNCRVYVAFLNIKMKKWKNYFSEWNAFSAKILFNKLAPSQLSFSDFVTVPLS